MDLRALVVVVFTTALSASVAPSTEMKSPPLAPSGCKYDGGWVIGPTDPPTAAITIYACGQETAIEFVELDRSTGVLQRLRRALVWIPTLPGLGPIPCFDEHDRLGNPLEIVAVLKPSDTNLGPVPPVVSQAWKADLQTWRLDELDPTVVQCYPMLGDG